MVTPPFSWGWEPALQGGPEFLEGAVLAAGQADALGEIGE